MILNDKKILITGILTDKSIAYASAKVAIENGAKVVATGFGKGLRITERAVKRLSDDIEVFEMDIENQDQVNEAVKNIEQKVGKLDGILHAIAFSPTEAMGGNFLNTSVEDAVKSFEISAFSLKTLATSFQPILNNPSSLIPRHSIPHSPLSLSSFIFIRLGTPVLHKLYNTARSQDNCTKSCDHPLPTHPLSSPAIPFPTPLSPSPPSS